MNWFKLLAVVIVTALWVPETAFAGSQCQVKLTKQTGKRISRNIGQSKSSHFDPGMRVTKIFLTAISNDIVVEVRADASLTFSLSATQKLLLPKGSRVTSIHCHSTGSRGKGTVKPTASQILELFVDSPSEAMAGLRDMVKKDGRSASKIMAKQGYTPPSIARAAKSAFGDTKATVRNVFKGMHDFKGSSLNDLQAIVIALTSTFSSTAASSSNLRVAMEEVQVEPALIAKVLEGIVASP